LTKLRTLLTSKPVISFGLPLTLLAAFHIVCAQTIPPAPSQTLVTAPIADQIAAILSTLAVARDHWGISVTTLDGTAIYSLNEAQLFQPASNAKLFTTAAAMALLGPDQRFTTRVEYGSAHGKTVEGDVTIIGAGDANFSDRELPYRGPNQTPPTPSVQDVMHLNVNAQGGGVAATPPNVPLRYLADFADQIATAGVKRITGDIVGDDTVFPWEPYPESWSIDDAVWGYGAPVSGLTVNDNQILVTVHPGKTAADKPTVEWPDGIPAYYQLDTTGLVTGRRKSASHVDFARDPGSRLLRISGSIAAGPEPDAEQIAIADPAEFAAIALKQLLEARGIKVDGVARAKHRVPDESTGFLAESRQPLPGLPPAIASYRTVIGRACEDACPETLQRVTAKVSEDIVLTNKVSQNLHAELLLHHLGTDYGLRFAGHGDGSTAEGARVIRQWLINAGIDPHDFVFYDGSGLSSHDLVTPRAIAKLLSYAANDPKSGQPQPWFAAWKSSLPIGGEDGSLASRFAHAPLKDHVFAKTGTLGEDRALSGYLDCASGRTVIFSILVGNHLPGTTDDRDAMDKIVAAIQASE
jgi:serine-type D-Ala-D-Ala carboxypeptidase/endopeptidase (penicillin-binding protein 4)